LKKINGEYAFVIRDLLDLIKKFYEPRPKTKVKTKVKSKPETKLDSVDYYIVVGQNEYIPQPCGGPNLFL
jgi:hypothetical protein